MKLRENMPVKVLAFLLAVAAFAAGAVTGWYQIVNFNAIWGDGSPTDCYTVRYLERQDFNNISQLLWLYNQEALGWELDISAAQEKLDLKDRFDTAATNLRWQALDGAGSVRCGNTGEEIPARAQGLYQSSYTWAAAVDKAQIESGEADWYGAAAGAVNVADPGNCLEVHNGAAALNEAVQIYRDTGDLQQVRDQLEAAGYISSAPDGIDLDTVFISADLGVTDVLTVIDEDGVHVYGPSIRNAVTVNEYGYRWDYGWLYAEDESGSRNEELTVVLWLANGLPAADEYKQAVVTLREWSADRGPLLAVAILCAAAGLLLTVFLCVACGHKKGREGISLNWFHRIPGDLLAAAVFLAGLLVLEAFFELLYDRILYSYAYMPMCFQLLIMGGLAAALAALCMAALITLVARCKSHTLLRNTVIWRLCGWCVRKIGQISRALPLIWKAALVSAVYLLFSIVFVASNEFLWGIATIILLCYLCLWAYQWKKIRQGAREIIGGNTDYKIDTCRMLPDLKAHADELNNLGQAVSVAVEDRMRSEHFKAELITNVSHDLKTPLTSIINYVDLLKKENIDNPKAAEYIEVLDRKSQRLKKLTEDLVEASKASTGSLTVARERLDLSQLVDQALAEYEDRLAQKGLTVVRTLPEEPVWVEADGRHLWRVIDNLLSNCAKYALEGTRVYAEVQRFSDCAALAIKNISRDELNVSPEQLMERFVRGDESRTAEGSGLGLSIAQSLTDLQHGQFRISIDGDLFKTIVTLPLAEAPAQE